jgi:hypothetical protein
MSAAPVEETPVGTTFARNNRNGVVHCELSSSSPDNDNDKYKEG